MNIKQPLGSKLHPTHQHIIRRVIIAGAIFTMILGSFFLGIPYLDQREMAHQETQALAGEKSDLEQQVLALNSAYTKLNHDYITLQNDDTYLKNANLRDEIANIEKTYNDAKDAYEQLLDIEGETGKMQPELEKLFARSLAELSDRKFTTAAATLNELKSGIGKTRSDLAAAQAKAAADLAAEALAKAAANVPISNSAPASGYSHQAVSVGGQSYLVDIIAGELGSTRVIVDTASNGDCGNDCPVMSVGAYAGRNGAYAAINGSYFCPASYPSCSGKTNSFDTLLMNKNKVYFNSSNNVYSIIPAVIFLGSSVRFVDKSQEWGRDTGIDSMIANQGLLLMGGQIRFSDNGDAKMTGAGTRGFVANKGNTVYIGMVRNVSVARMAQVLQAMGMDNALNLDSGGSSALMFNGRYLVGPGRDVPNSILFVRK